jgi:chromate transporter
LIRRVRYIIFLKDVLLISLSAFGGPQAHLAMLFEVMVRKRRYLSEEDLIELNALCQILPGPTSTQTITAIGFRTGGPNLAYLTLIVWILPAVTLMTMAAILISNFQEKNALTFTRFIQPMAVGFVAYAAYKIVIRVVRSKTAAILMVASAIISYKANSPYAFPIILLLSGLITAFKYKKHPIEEKMGIRIQWSNFILWAGVFILAAVLGGITQYKPILLFENFYRSGSLIFGGGQVLIPFLYTEFVDFKEYLTSEEFLTGYAIGQSVPGPVFSFTSYIGSLSMRQEGITGELLGSLAATAGIFLPGTFLIFFVIRFWDQLKRYRIVRASLEGINAASAGMVASAAVLMFLPLTPNLLNFGLTIGTFLLLQFTRIPAPLLIFAGLIAGIFL